MVIITNYASEKVDTPLAPLMNKIAESPVFIAPQREEEFGHIMQECRWTYEVNVDDGGAGISADPENGIINLPLAQLERLWAMTYGFLVSCEFARTRISPGVECGPSEFPELGPPLNLITWAYDGLRQRKRFSWPASLPRPDRPGSCDPEHLERVNLHFLGALGFIVLHEVAHLYLKHPLPKFQSPEESIGCEIQADMWAADWIMDKCPNKRDVRIFRGSCCVIALSLINLFEFSTGPQSGRQTHPPSVERLLNLANRHIRESDGPNASVEEYPLYLGSTILHIQRLNLGLDVASGVSHDSFMDYHLDALRVFRERRFSDENEVAFQERRNQWIRENAYFRWVERGRSGCDMEDWLEAEREFDSISMD